MDEGGGNYQASCSHQVFVDNLVNVTPVNFKSEYWREVLTASVAAKFHAMNSNLVKRIN
jgi:hypothetical protein